MKVVRPHNLWSLNKGVTGTAPVATFPLSYLTDGIPGTPAKWAATGCNFTVTGTAQLIDVLVLANTNLFSPATAVVSGDVSASFTLATAPPSGIARPYVIELGSPVSVDDLTVTIAGATNPIVVGEFMVGLSDTWDFLAADNAFEYHYKNIDLASEMDQSSVPPHDIGVEYWTGGGSNYADHTQLQFLWDWVGGARGNTRPSIVIPNPGDGFALPVKMDLQVSYSQQSGTPRRNMASVSFVSYESGRW